MAGGSIAGGLLSGLGKGLSEQNTQEVLERRLRVLEGLRQGGFDRRQEQRIGANDARAQRTIDAADRRAERGITARASEGGLNRAAQADLNLSNRAGRAEEGVLNRAGRLDVVEAQNRGRIKERQGMLGSTERFQDSKGFMWIRRGDNTVQPVKGPDGKQLRGALKKGTVGAAAGAGLSASDKRTIDTTIKRFTDLVLKTTDWDKVAHHLRTTGHPELAAFISGSSGAISFAQATERARAEADDRAGILSSDKTDFPDDGGRRERFITRRTQEIMRGGGGATRQPKASKAPPSGTSTGRPPKPTNHPDATWSTRANAWVVKRDGKWFRVTQ